MKSHLAFPLKWQLVGSERCGSLDSTWDLIEAINSGGS
jgi:hypothetical protein